MLEAEIGLMLDIVTNTVPDPASVAAIRWRLAQALFDHCAREDRTVYDRLLASGDAIAIATAWAYRREYGALGEAFGRYIAEWPVDKIARDWTGFRLETAAMMHRIRGRIASEESNLYPHAQRVLDRRAA